LSSPTELRSRGGAGSIAGSAVVFFVVVLCVLSPGVARAQQAAATITNPFSGRADESALASRRERTGQAYLVKPVIRRGVHRGERNNVIPHLGGRSIDADAVLDNASLILPHFPFRQSRNQQHRDHAQIHRRRF